MTNQERTVRADSILRRQNSGKLSKWDASAEFDRLLDESSGDLHFYSDTTCLRDTWDSVDVMVYPHQESAFGPNVKPTPSNTGIITQGPKRGLVVLKPGHVASNAHMSVIEMWGGPGERKYSPEKY